ncbi:MULTISPECIES: hypothetical protein [unclassified Variovorax]|uniref:hypothetical protein n=1 Tax=unclassified Variovorax TaxID=663243 RepID=UPI0008388845|nr:MULTISPECIES: hypothetical protein [unclassified Variovorax]PNG49167.1 hypothetical protein CHC06_06404 [Variovorax sp. B2]PNG49552.1 hypothetical protein CHC07_06461 [Variovorax sp. B4]VTV18795.1 hypothetical protein WDL1P2_00436 [Variovorax sp. WDL1]
MTDHSHHLWPCAHPDEVTVFVGDRLGAISRSLKRCVAVGGSATISWSPFLHSKGSFGAGDALLLRTYSPKAHLLEQHLHSIDETLSQMRSDVVAVLGKGGLSEESVETLLNYFELKFSTQREVSEVLADAERAFAARRDSAESLSAVELGGVLGVTDETVRNREQAGELFSILRPGRKRGREYPAFQAWDGVTGEPLRQVLAALGRPSGPAAYGFFTSPQDTLAGLTPLEALVGLTGREVAPEAQEFLGSDASDRLAVVLQAAQTYASSLAA